LKAIPSYDEILKMLKEKGVTEQEFKERIEKKRNQYAGFVSDINVLAYLVARDYGVSIPLDIPSQVMNLGQVLNIEDENLLFSVKGWVGDVYERHVKGKTRYYVLLVDETGMVLVGIFGGAVEKWQNYNVGDYVQIDKVSIWKRNDGSKILTATGLSEITKISGKNFDEFLAAQAIGEGKYVMVTGVPIEMRRRQYVGCPRCFRKKEGEEGMEVECCNSAPIKLTKLSWVSYTTLTIDGTRRIEIEFDPSYKVGPELLGVVLKVYGIYQDSVLSVCKYEVLKGPDTAVPEKYFEKDKLLVTADQIYELINAFGSLPSAVLQTMVERRFGLSKELLQKLLDELKGKNKIKIDENGVVRRCD
jgi:hypothetical protein